MTFYSPERRLPALPKEDQLKVVKVAEDILDRNIWTTGCLHMGGWLGGGEAYCAIGAIREALGTLGHLSDTWKEERNCGREDDEVYREVAEAFGVNFVSINDVWRANDKYGRGEAFRIINDIVNYNH